MSMTESLRCIAKPGTMLYIKYTLQWKKGIFRRNLNDWVKCIQINEDSIRKIIDEIRVVVNVFPWIKNKNNL